MTHQKKRRDRLRNDLVSCQGACAHSGSIVHFRSLPPTVRELPRLFSPSIHTHTHTAGGGGKAPPFFPRDSFEPSYMHRDLCLCTHPKRKYLDCFTPPPLKWPTVSACPKTSVQEVRRIIFKSRPYKTRIELLKTSSSSAAKDRRVLPTHPIPPPPPRHSISCIRMGSHRAGLRHTSRSYCV